MSPGGGRVPMRNWVLCLLLFLATTLNYLDRQTMSIVAPFVQREMGLDNEALGWLFSVFYYSYTIAQFGIGLALDRWNLRWAFALAVLAWSAVAALTATAGGFAGLIVFRLLLGVTESANWPAAMRIVARALPPKDRALGNGIFTSGTSVGALIAPALILGLTGRFGWRTAFVAVGSLGLFWFAGWLAFTRHASFTPVWRAGGAARPAAAYRSILGRSQFWRVFAVTVLVNPCLYFNVNWLPAYFAQARGMTPGASLGWALTLIYLGLDLGYLACGAGVRFLVARGFPVAGARKAVFLSATALLPLSALAPWIQESGGAVAALMVVNFAIGAWIAMYLTMAQEVSPEHVSTAAGLLGGSGSLAGALAMWAVGVVTKQTGSFAIPFAAVTVAGILAAAAGLSVCRARPAVEASSNPA